MRRNEGSAENLKKSSNDMLTTITQILRETIQAYKAITKPNPLIALFQKHAIGHSDGPAKIQAAEELLSDVNKEQNDQEKLAKLLGGIKFFIDQGGFFGDTLAEKLVAKKDYVQVTMDSDPGDGEHLADQEKFEPGYLALQGEIQFAQNFSTPTGNDHSQVTWTNRIDIKKEYEDCATKVLGDPPPPSYSAQNRKTEGNFKNFGKPDQQEMKEMNQGP